MLIDKFLQKATKAKKQPHWCVDHQKWETEKHDTIEPWNNQVQKAGMPSLSDMTTGKGSTPAKTASGWKATPGFGTTGSGMAEAPEDADNVHMAVIPVMHSVDKAEESLTRWMPPGTPRDPRERPMTRFSPEELKELAAQERTFPKKNFPKVFGEGEVNPGSAPSPGTQKDFVKFHKMWVRKSTPRPLSVIDNLLFLLKADTSSEVYIGPEDIDKMGLHQGPAEMKHVINIPMVGKCQVSNIIKGPGQHGHPEGRTMLVVTLPNGERQPFYTRTGTGGPEGSSKPGEFVPIDGISTGDVGMGIGWFNKHRMFDRNKPSDHEMQRYGKGKEGLTYFKIAKTLDALREEGRIATPEDLVAAGHAKLPGIDDPNERGPWSHLEINNWLGNDIALGHNASAHANREHEYLKENWVKHNQQRVERGDRGAPHNGLPNPVQEDEDEPPFRFNPRYSQVQRQWNQDTKPGAISHHITEHMAKPEAQRNEEFNQYAREMWNGQRHTWQDHEKHFHHAMSGFGRFTPRKGHRGYSEPQHLDGLPLTKDGRFTFSEIYPHLQERNRTSQGMNWEPTPYSVKKHGPGGYGDGNPRTGPVNANRHDRGWFADRNAYQFDRYPKIMEGIENKTPTMSSSSTPSPLTGDEVKAAKEREERMKLPAHEPIGAEPGHFPDFVHPHHAEQHQLMEQEEQGEAMRQAIPPESPLRGGLPEGIQNALLKLMKADEEEPVDSYLPKRMKGDEQTYDRDEAPGFPTMPTDYIDVADDPEHWRHGSPNIARPKRVNIVDEGSHPAWQGAPNILEEPEVGIAGFPEVSGEPHSDIPGKWPKLTVPAKQTWERDEKKATPSSYKRKGKPKFVGRGNVQNSIENSFSSGEPGDEEYDGPISKSIMKSLLKVMQKGSDLDPAKVGMTRANALKGVEKAPAAEQQRESSEQIEARTSGGNPNLDPAGLGAEAAGLVGSLAGMAAGGKRQRWLYEPDTESPPGTGQSSNGTSSAPVDPHSNTAFNQQGSGNTSQEDLGNINWQNQGGQGTPGQGQSQQPEIKFQTPPFVPPKGAQGSPFGKMAKGRGR